MDESKRKVAYLTAGAAGMFCGSCMLDNTLVRALIRRDVDAQLIPTYTPIRTDEDDVSIDRVFFGGINVYLQQKIPLFRHIPRFLDRFLDKPWLIRRLTAKAVEIDPKVLGGLAVSMLKGSDGFQKKEVKRLCRWLKHTEQPDIVHFTNMLIAGCVPSIKRDLQRPVVVTLQGDDIFLESLDEPYRSRALAEIHRLVKDVDAFVVHSQYYADFMADYFEIDAAKLHVIRLGIDTEDLQIDPPPVNKQRPPTVGYLARLAPEKGLHLLVDAFLELRKQPGMEDARLRIAGWLGSQNEEYAEAEFEKLRSAGHGDAFEYVGVVDREHKVEFLHSIDVLSVPTTYHDPKGLFLLEAMAVGVPVVQPAHGAFPEVIQATEGGRLVEPESSSALANGLHELLLDQDARQSLGNRGSQLVHERHTSTEMAGDVLKIYERLGSSYDEPLK